MPRNLIVAATLLTAVMPQLALTQGSSRPVVESRVIPTAEDEQALRQSLVLEVPLADLWYLFTTDQGVTEWMAPVG